MSKASVVFASHVPDNQAVRARRSAREHQFGNLKHLSKFLPGRSCDYGQHSKSAIVVLAWLVGCGSKESRTLLIRPRSWILHPELPQRSYEFYSHGRVHRALFPHRPPRQL